MQHTIATSVACRGISLHQGKQTSITLHPAPPDHGIVFRRTDIAASADRLVCAHYSHVVDTRLCTVLENAAGVRVSTVEHLMAALWGCGVDNARIDIDGPEVPVMDGSSEPFMFLIECAGVNAQEVPRRYIVIDTPVFVEEGEACAVIQPSADGAFRLDVDIQFAHSAIGHQHRRFDSATTTFKQALARARTFGFLRDVQALREAGLARGGSLHNALVIDDNGVLNEEGVRYSDECVRHKMLDCIGDYYLAGAPLLGHVKTSKPGHSLNNKLLRTLCADRGAWHYATLPEQESELPAHLLAAASGAAASAASAADLTLHHAP